MYDVEYLRSPPSHVVAQYRTLCNEGIGGRPLYEVGADGRVTMHVLLELDRGRVALAPITLFGPEDLEEFAQLSESGSSDHERILVVRDGEFFANDRNELPWQRRFENEVAWLAACLLGAAGIDHHDSPLRKLLHSGPAVRSLQSVDSSHIEVPDPDFWATGAPAAQRSKIETDLRRRFACLDGTVFSSASQPTWAVSVSETGVINVRASPYNFVHLGSADTPVVMPFSAAKEREANIFAHYMATMVENGRVRHVGKMRVFRPDLATFDRSEVGLHLDYLLKRMDRVAPLLASDSLDLLLVMQGRLNGGEPAGADREAFVAEWTAFSRSLRGDFASPDIRDGLDEDGARWERRFAISRHALDYVLGLVDASEVAVPEVIEPVALPVDLEPGKKAIRLMAELLVQGGETYKARWKDARDAIDAFEKSGTRESALIAWRTMSDLVETIPEAFPSAPSSSRWAMNHRPALKELIARVATEFSFLQSDLQGAT